MAPICFLDRGDGVRLAYAFTPGRGPTVVFLPGYMSDMGGTKALYLEAWAEESGRAFLRLDYSGCGASEGAFAAGTIRRWAADAQAIIEAVAGGPLVLVGSSMGGWIMLHLALALGPRVEALVGVAAAPDFTRWGLMLTAAEKAELARGRDIFRPSAYGMEPYRYTPALLADGEAACLLDTRIPFAGPVRLLHGMADQDVPYAVSLRLANALTSTDVRVHLLKTGDHRLSTPADLALLAATLEALP
ncbi:alpha/beta fold hydrolase [Thermaurantiacus sp.]